MPREHGDDGAFIETIRPADVRAVLNAVEGPVILSADVADALDCSRETARRKLEQLHDRGDLARRKVSRRVIYWDPDDTTDAGGVSDDGERYPTDSDGSQERGVTTSAGEPQAGPPADALDAVDAADADPEAGTDGAAIPGDVDRDDAAAAVAAARDYIRDHGGATKQDLVKNVMPAHPLVYDVDAALAKIDGPDRYRGAWWRNVVSPGLKALDDVQTPPQGGNTWRYSGK